MWHEMLNVNNNNNNNWDYIRICDSIEWFHQAWEQANYAIIAFEIYFTFYNIVWLYVYSFTN